jgi:hypothetical protein
MIMGMSGLESSSVILTKRGVREVDMVEMFWKAMLRILWIKYGVIGVARQSRL